MSLVFIVKHNENVYDMEKEEVPVRSHHNIAVKKKTGYGYVSKFSKDLKRREAHAQGIIDLKQGNKLLTSAPKYKNRTMGHAQTPLSPPCDFLRKDHGVKWRRLREHVCPPGPGAQRVPRRNEMSPVRKQAKDKTDFIKRNVQLVKGNPAVKPVPRYVDTPHGERRNLLHAGLLPEHICADKFGRVPNYLYAQKKRLAQMRIACTKIEFDKDAYCAALAVKGLKVLPQEERDTMIKGLKENHHQLSKVYHALPLHTDTITKKARKTKIDKDLRQMEQDMAMLAASEDIYVPL